GDRRTAAWTTRATSLRAAFDEAQTRRSACGDSVRISDEVDVDRLRTLATQLRTHLANGGEVKLDKSGDVKIGLFTSGEIKAAQPFFARVKVNGGPAATVELIDLFAHHLAAEESLRRLRELVPEPG